MNIAERYYLVDHLEKAIVREDKNRERATEEYERAEVPSSPYAEARRDAIRKAEGTIAGLREALSIVRGLS